MKLTRTTLRLKTDLKKQAEKMALEQDLSLQEIFNTALEKYLQSKAKQNAKRIVFHTHDLGVALDNLTRDDIYQEPKN